MRTLACRIFEAPAIAILLFAAVGAQAASLTADLDRTTVPVGETVTLNLNFEGINPQGTPSLPALPNLAFQGVRQSTSMIIINGQSSSKVTYSYVLQATQPGEVTIPAMQFQAGGQIVASQPLQLKIVPAAGGANAATNIAFIRLIVPKTEVYLHEALPIEMHLYCQTVQDVQMPQLKAEGFTLTHSTEQPAQSQTQLNGAVYNLFVFRLSATPARVGRVTLGPAECSLTLLIPIRRSRDPFDPLGLFGPSHQRRPTTLQSDPVVMNVQPLPSEDVPPTFNGAVGNFVLAVTAAPTNVAVGDPITVKVNISGRGRLDAIKLPPQPQWRDFNTYSATKKIESSDPIGLAGTAAIEQIITPQNHEVRQLPPVEFSFFDPAQGQYRTLRSQTIPLTVRNASVAVVPPPAPTNAAASAQQPVDDILHIRSQFGAAAAPGLLIRQPWFIGLQFVPIAAWIGLVIARKRREVLENNPRLRRRREVAQRVRHGVKELHALAAAQDSDAFFATLFRVLQEQIGERLDVPASAITEAVIDERLRDSALPSESLAALHDLFQTCNQARYAPHKSRQELSAIIPRVERVLSDLQRLNP
ncbi:MAG: BatD family protein [Verrucomicrobia subdivision 3 bacterium]|nr:BatD family protein [Limisphaerales bacterium]